MEAEKMGIEGEAFLHYIQEQERIRRDELQQYYADRERQRKEQVRQRKDRRRREAEEQKSERQDQGLVLPSVYSVRGPHLPFPQFVDGRDNIDSFVRRFENWATQVELPRQHWSAHLGNTLSGVALDVFTHLPPSSQLDYNVLKRALLARYNLTEEGYRKKFRESDQEAQKETPLQFMCRLNDCFDRWVLQSGVSHDYEGLKWLMVKEQFLNKCGKGLATFVRERAPKDSDELVTHVGLYLEARGLSTINSANQGASSSQPASRNRVDDRAAPRTEGNRRPPTGTSSP